MDTLVPSQILRQLFSHQVCSRIRYRESIFVSSPRKIEKQTRGFSCTRHHYDTSLESRWQQRTSSFPQDRSEEFARYPMVDADMLRSRINRPKRVKMLMRDFIEGRDFLHMGIIWLIVHFRQTASTTQTMVTFRSTWLSSVLVTALISTR